MLRRDYEIALGRYLGASNVIWLGSGCTGDDTHGHIDDIARFYAPGSVLVSVTDDHQDEHYERFQDNLNRLRRAKDAAGNPLVIRTLPSPRAVYMDGERVPASYANFYIGNKTVMVPTFNDEMDRVALATIAACFPTRSVVGVHARDFIIGYGSLHCSTQQQPRV
jgi:agmatine deiminase